MSNEAEFGTQTVNKSSDTIELTLEQGPKKLTREQNIRNRINI